jgi:hypothetical protein
MKPNITEENKTHNKTKKQGKKHESKQEKKVGLRGIRFLLYK